MSHMDTHSDCWLILKHRLQFGAFQQQSQAWESLATDEVCWQGPKQTRRNIDICKAVEKQPRITEKVYTIFWSVDHLLHRTENKHTNSIWSSLQAFKQNCWIWPSSAFRTGFTEPLLHWLCILFENQSNISSVLCSTNYSAMRVQCTEIKLVITLHLLFCLFTLFLGRFKCNRRILTDSANLLSSFLQIICWVCDLFTSSMPGR